MENLNKTICLFTDTFCDANGVSRFAQDMSKVANSCKKPLYVITSTSKSNCDEGSNVYNLKPIFRMKMPFYKELDFVLPPFFKMYELAKKIQPDVAHISTPGLVGLYGYVIARRLKCDIVGTYHTDFPMYVYKNTNSKIAKKITTWLLRLFYKKFKIILARSKEYVAIIHRDIKKDLGNIAYLQPGVNTNTFGARYADESIWKEYAIDKNLKKFLYVGRLSPEKNVDFLFDVWKDFYQRSANKNICLVMVGSGDLDKFKEQLQKYQVYFLGHKEKEELASIYASSDIFLFPSVTDTLGQVVLEALVSGTPTIVSDIGGPKTIIQGSQERVGFVLSPNDKQKWIETLNAIASDQAYLQKISRNAQNYAQSLSIDKTFESFYKAHHAPYIIIE